jgi:hypothetical protein
MNTKDFSSIFEWNTRGRPYRFNVSSFNRNNISKYAGSHSVLQWNERTNVPDIFSILNWSLRGNPRLFNNEKFNIRG